MTELSEQPAVAGAARETASAARSCFVVEDDAGICKALSFTLRRLGFETTEIATPDDLDQALDAGIPQLIFLDLGLGKAGAGDVLPILSRHGYNGPVQLMSGRSQGVLDEVVSEGEQFGLTMLPALVKPFRMGVVKDVVAGLGLAPPAGDGGA